MEENSVHGIGPKEYRKAFKKRLIPVNSGVHVDRSDIYVEPSDIDRVYTVKGPDELELLPGLINSVSSVIGPENKWNLI